MLKHGDLNALVCTAAILFETMCQLCFGVASLTPVQGNIDSGKYIEVLDQYLWPVIAKELPNRCWTFQEDNCPCMCQDRPLFGKLKTSLRPYHGHHSPQTLI